MQELWCSFFLHTVFQPYCWKKTSWGRINQNLQTAGEATEPAKAEHRAARLAAPPQPGAPQLPLLNLFPTAPSSVRLSISTLACFSLQHLTLSSFLEDLVPVDSALPNQPTQQKSLKQSLIFYHILLTPSITSSFPEALSQ